MPTPRQKIKEYYEEKLEKIREEEEILENKCRDEYERSAAGTFYMDDESDLTEIFK